MRDKSIEYEVHNYEALNSYIDEQGRIRRTKSWWGYSKAIALFLVGLGIFLILAAYAYHIYKKPHKLLNRENIVKKENIKKKEREIDGKKIVYSSTVDRFDSYDIDGYQIITGYEWNTVDDLRFGHKHVKDWCYLSKGGLRYFYDSTDQSEIIKLLGSTRSKINSYQKYCTN